jgi:hypothetical protein
VPLIQVWAETNGEASHKSKLAETTNRGAEF